MRPNTSVLTDLSFTQNPELTGSYLALARQLGDGGADAPPESLPLIEILRELETAARSGSNGRFMSSRDDRESLRDDLRRSLEAPGPALKARLRSGIDDLRHELGNLPDQLTNAAGCTILLGHARAPLERLRNPEATHAAWRDVVSTFETDASAEACELTIAQLRAIAEFRGHEWPELSGRLRGVLVDSPAEVARAQGQPVDIAIVTRRDPTGIPIEERIKLAEHAAGEPPPENRVVMWLAYANAHLQSPFHLEIGNHVTLYGSDLWDDQAVLRAGGYPRPPELDDPGRDLFFRERPAETFVLIRIELGRHGIDGARRRARAIAAVLPDLVDTSSGWRLMEGETGWVEDGSWFGSVAFEDPAARAVRSTSWGRYTDPMRGLLADLDPEFVNRLVEQDERTEELIDGYRWRGAVRRAPDVAQRVVLAIQAIERSLISAPATTPSVAHWAELVERYLALMWSQHHISTFAWEAGYYGVHALPDRHESQGGVHYRRYSRELIDEGKPGFKPIQVKLEATARAANQIASHIDAGRIERRLLEELAQRTASPEAARAWLSLYTTRFKILLHRAVRQRNVVTHGGLGTAEVLESIVRFAAWIENMLLGAHYHALNAHEHPVLILQRWRLNALDRRAKLEAGEDPVSTLLGGPVD